MKLIRVVSRILMGRQALINSFGMKQAMTLILEKINVLLIFI